MGLRPDAITFDFGNTLVPIRHDDMRRVVERTAARVSTRSGPFGADTFAAIWHDERARQFAEDVPRGREVDIEQRVARVLARLRGMGPPPDAASWDDDAAARLSEPDERAAAVDAYSDAFVATAPVPRDIGALLGRLAAGHQLGLVSNWPLAVSIDRFLEKAGWDRYLKVVVVSQRVGAIKPHPRIFRAAEAALGVHGEAILHVGDDWVADVCGAKGAGWRAAYLLDGQAGSPLPASTPDDSVAPDVVLRSLAALEDVID